MKTTRIMGLVMLAALTLTACVDETAQRQYSFNATMEQLRNADNSKVQLVNEEWTYWEYNDAISLVSNASTRDGINCELFSGWLVNGGAGDYSNYDGVFISTLTESSEGASNWFVGIHPANNQKHKITFDGSGNHGFAAKVYLEPIQHYRHDSSYARQVLPMIATYDGPKWGDGDGETSTPYRLDFHTLAGLVRLQIVNGTNNVENISKIELTSIDFASTPEGDVDGTAKRPLCGLFDVNNLYNFDAHLNKSGFGTPDGGDGYTLTLSMSEDAASGSLEFRPNDLKSFYVVLPAFHGIDVSTYYRLKMTVYTDNNNKKFSKNFTVRTRRNGITYMRAINITEFVDAGSGENGTGDPVLVGNGTKTRPFKIYTFADLKYVRDQFETPDVSSGNVYINGQRVTEGTYFRVMRSDITLSNSPEWTGGIKNFKGHFTYYTNSPLVTHGIKNRSNYPLFESISSEGYVNDLNVICDSTIVISDNSLPSDYSPFCGTNNGHITDCRVISPNGLANNLKNFIGKGTQNSCFAGICITNNSGAVITNCQCAVIRTMNTYISHFGGICKDNYGTIDACVAASPMTISGAGNAGGICYINRATVKNCYSDFHYTTTTGTGQTNWGGIVYENYSGGSLIQNCYFSFNGMIRSFGNVGGIVCVNTDGVVNYCRSERGSLMGSVVGGIASSLLDGEVRNCFINDSNMVIYLYNNGSTHSAGGLVGYMDGGTLKNCFALLNHIDIAASDNSGKVGAVVGNLNYGAVNNCYGLSTTSSVPTFYGTIATEAPLPTLTNCFLIDGTQSGVVTIYGEDDHTDSGEDVLNDLTELLDKLNETAGGNYVGWLRNRLTTDPNHYNDTRTPYLQNPYGPTKRNTRK